MCVVGFALPSSVFCAGEELHYLFLQCKATTRRDLTQVSRFIIVTINTAYPRDTQCDAYMSQDMCCITLPLIFFHEVLHCDQFVLEFFFRSTYEGSRETISYCDFFFCFSFLGV
jgi:hypothetical protein